MLLWPRLFQFLKLTICFENEESNVTPTSDISAWLARPGISDCKIWNSVWICNCCLLLLVVLLFVVVDMAWFSLCSWNFRLRVAFDEFFCSVIFPLSVMHEWHLLRFWVVARAACTASRGNRFRIIGMKWSATAYHALYCNSPPQWDRLVKIVQKFCLVGCYFKKALNILALYSEQWIFCITNFPPAWNLIPPHVYLYYRASNELANMILSSVWLGLRSIKNEPMTLMVKPRRWQYFQRSRAR